MDKIEIENVPTFDVSNPSLDGLRASSPIPEPPMMHIPEPPVHHIDDFEMESNIYYNQNDDVKIKVDVDARVEGGKQGNGIGEQRLLEMFEQDVAQELEQGLNENTNTK